MTPARREHLIGILWVAAIVVIWSAFHLSGRISVQFVLTPFDLTTLRVAVAAIVLFPWLLRHGLWGINFWQACLLALTAGPGFAVFAFGGYLFAPAAHGATILAGTLPLFTAPLAWWLVGERMSGWRAVSVAMILAGAMFLVFDASDSGRPNEWLGDLFFFVGAASWSLYGVLIRKWQVTPLRSAAIVAIFTFALYSPVHLLFLPSGLLQFDNFPPWPEVALQTVYQGIVASFIVVILVTRATRSISATTMAVLLSGAPALAVLFGIVLLDEWPTVLAWSGLAVTTAGMVFAVGRRD